MPCGRWLHEWIGVAAGRSARTFLAAASAGSLLLAPVATRVYAASTHVVQPGETLSDIATSAGVDSATLATLNAIDDANLLVAGQTLKLPAGSSPAAAVAAPVAATAPVSASTSPGTYTVAEGDTLWGVAQQLSTTTAALVEANHLADADHLVVGAQLTVPGGAAAPSSPAPVPVPVAAAPKPAALASTSGSPRRSLLVSYTVQSGETLNQIARQFDIPAAVIVQASSLDDPNRLAVGTVLKVPLPGREHVVQAGETLRDIAAREKVDLGSLVDFNALEDPELIRIGQVVLVPPTPNVQTAAENTQTSAKPAPPAAPAPAAQPAAKPAAPAPPPKPAPAPKPSNPVAVLAPPRGSPNDGLAGAGLKLLGSPYVWGGSSPNGFDCSGFVWYVAREAGKQISRGMLGEYDAGPHPSRDELKPGDLVFFQNTYSAGLSHNGVYIGNGQFVHAADEAVGVTISSLGTPYWSSHWFGATRLP